MAQRDQYSHSDVIRKTRLLSCNLSMMLHKSDTEILEMLFECWQNAASVVLNVYLIALM